MGTYFMPETILNALHVLSHLIFTKTCDEDATVITLILNKRTQRHRKVN